GRCERVEEWRETFGGPKSAAWKTAPMDMFERQMMVPVEACEEPEPRIALEFLPADLVALASDWPHYDGTPDLLAGFEKAAAKAGIDAADEEMLATGTFENWFPR